MKAKLLVVAIVCCLVAVGCSSDSGATTSTTAGSVSTSTSVAPTTTTAPTTTSAPDVSRFEAALVGFVGGEEGGASAVFEAGGVVEVVTAGVASGGGDAIAADTPFHVGSISKTVTATLVWMLIDEGRLDLDEELSAYIPDIEVGGQSTIRSLLGHRSGIPSYTDHPEFFRTVLADLDQSWVPTDMLGYVGASDGGNNQEFAYSNTNYVLLGMLIESVHGADLNSVLQTELAEPLGLTNTAYAGAGALSPQPAAPFVPNNPESGVAGTPYESVTSSAYAAGALVSTASELRVFLRALLSRDLVSESSLTEMTKPQFEYYGLGIEIMDLEADAVWLGHGGSIPGYNSVMGADLGTGQLIVVLTNNGLLDPAEFIRQFLSSQ